jgi:hypothetical protein
LAATVTTTIDDGDLIREENGDPGQTAPGRTRARVGEP